MKPIIAFRNFVNAPRNAYRILVGICERKRPFGTSRNRRNDDIKMHLQNIQDGRASTRLCWLRIMTNDVLL
jgi:hypothetical protein